MRAPARRRPALDETALLEIAHLQCSWRMTRGAAHTLNNALTAVTGLVEAPGEEGELERELDRCARVARNLTAHHAVRFGRSEETELGALLRQVKPILEDTLGRRVAVSAEAPPDLLYVEADPARLELLALLLAYRLTDLCSGNARLRVAVGPGDKPESAALELDLHAEGLDPSALEDVLDPAAVTGPGAPISLEAAFAVVAGCGGALAARPLPGGIRVRALFPSLQPD